ncbi:hypothetical protein VTI74DRAFT_6241 [Chaetomium olivicolor]
MGTAPVHFDHLPEKEKMAVHHYCTRVRKCYGWVCVHGKNFRSLNWIEVDDYAGEKGDGSANHLASDSGYYAIVHEYLPEIPFRWRLCKRS